MHKHLVLLLPLLGVLAAGCMTVGPASERAVIQAKDKVAPALVHIRPVKEVYAGGKREEIVVEGSGFIISPDGYVVTNEHVAGESRVVRCVLFAKEEMDAKVVGVDGLTDIAVIKLDTARKDLPYVKLGRSDNLVAGQTVLALGSPHGLARSVSQGIVSVPDRFLDDGGGMTSPYNNWIQTDAAINPGNSGGPLVNLKGEVIGVNARRLNGADNVGFAIPVDVAKQVVEAIIRDGRVRRSWAGVSLQEMMSKTDDPSIKGVVIGNVDPLSPAAEAGVKPGDTLLAVNGAPVDARYAEDLPAVRRLIASLPVGEEAVFQISRGGETTELKVKTEEEAELQGAEVEFKDWGFTATDLTPEIMRRAQLPSRNGVMITGTQDGELAQNAGLGQSDIILGFDGQEITNMAAFKRLVEEAVASKKPLVLLDVKRGALTRYVLLKQDGEEMTNEGEADDAGL